MVQIQRYTMTIQYSSSIPTFDEYIEIRSQQYCRMQIRWELHRRCASIIRIAAYKLNIEKIGLSLTIR